MPPKEVFLSHSSKDKRFAASVVDLLRRHGLPVWYSGSNIVGAQQWHDEIGAALLRCDWFVLILSPNSVGSIWVQRELSYVLNDARYANRIVPVLHRACDYAQLSWVLPSFQRVDFTQDVDRGCRALLRVWGVGYDGGGLAQGGGSKRRGGKRPAKAPPSRARSAKGRST